MTVGCPKCQMRYEFATVRLKGKDRTATCGKCGHRFMVKLDKPKGAGPTTATAAGDPSVTMVGRARAPGAGLGFAPHVRIALTALDGARKDAVFLIDRTPTVIGRSEGEIQIPDPRVSGRHAQVELIGGEVWLRDLGSTNGTLVNGERVDRVRLKHMDEIVLGSSHLLYTFTEDLVSAFEALAPEP